MRRKIRPWGNQINNVLEGGEHDGALRDAAFDPAIAEKPAAEKFFGGADEERAHAAAQALAKATPGHLELRNTVEGRGFERGKRSGLLAEKAERVAGLAK